MSALAPRIVEKDMTKLLTNAVKLLNNNYPEENFPIIKDEDPGNILEGKYMAIEAKNILCGILLGDLWPELVKKNPRLGLPSPAECPPGYRISTASWWPQKGEMEGIVGTAADLQVDTLADVTFTRLMYLSSKDTAKKHASLLTDSIPTAFATEDQEMEDAADNNNNGDVPAGENLLPAVWLEGKAFRLTRDWSKWPSAGVIGYPVSDLQQAQYGVIADVVFESMKIEMLKAKSKTAKAFTGEFSQDGADLADDSGAAGIYIPLLQAYLDDKSIKGRLFKNASKNLAAELDQFREWFNTNAEDHNMAYVDAMGEQQDFSTQFDNIPTEGLGSFYTRACKTFSKNKTGAGSVNSENMSASVGTPSLAPSASLIGGANDALDDSTQAAPRRRGPAAATAPGRRGPAAAPATRSSGLGRGAGAKRTRGDEDDDEEFVPAARRRL